MQRFKMEKLSQLCARNRVDILCIQETHLLAGDPRPRGLAGMAVAARADSPGQSRKGGCIIMANPLLRAEVLAVPGGEGLEVCAARFYGLGSDALPFVVVCVYVTPSPGRALDLLCNAHDALPRNLPVIYVGDFNPSLYDFDAFLEHTGAQEMNRAQVPTYFHGLRSSTPDRVLLCPHSSWDLLPASSSSSDEDGARALANTFPAEVLPAPRVSDHAAILWRLPAHGDAPAEGGRGQRWMAKLRWLSDEEWATADADLRLQRPPTILCNRSAEAVLSTLVARVRKVVADRSRQVRPRRSSETPLEQSVRWLLQSDPDFAARFLEQRDPNSPDPSATALNELQFETLEREKARLWRKRVAAAPRAGALWGFLANCEAQAGGPVRSPAAIVSCSAPLLPEGATAAPECQATLLAKHYAKRGELKAAGPDSATRRLLAAPSSPPAPVTAEEVAAAARSLRPASAPGRDGIPATAWGRLPSTYPHLAAVFTHCLRSGFVPPAVLLTDVVPIPKVGRSGLAAFRPISLLPSVSKILERIVLQRVLATVGEKLPSEQYAYKQGHSRDMLLADLGRVLGQAQDEGKQALLVSLDIRGAYDSVTPRRMLRKAADFGLPAWSIRLLRSWLYRRHLRVRVRTPFGRVFSRDERVTCGLPQGGVLSPMLWVIFLHDLKCFLSRKGVDWSCSHLAVYADDITLLLTADSVEALERIQALTLAAIHEYCRSNGLDL